MIDKQDAIVSLLKEIDKNVENLGVGGGNTPTSISGGYPVVTVEDDFNITAEPNTFYDIKNDTNSEININFVEDGYSTRF
jgi:DNA polymerase III sliding clamp (beta) subunit (PCNA family)